MSNDIGPWLQDQYDAGHAVTLQRGKTYSLDTPVFLDSAGFGDKLALDINGATITLGDSLPTVGEAFLADPSVRAGIFSNVKRSAWDPETNTVDAKGGKATSAGASVRLVVSNGRVVGGANNVGLAFGNRVGAVLDNVNLIGGRFAWSWTGYGEPHVVRGCHFQTAGGTAQVPDAFFLYGNAKGDGVQVEALKCDGAVGAVSLRECFGASLTANITGKVRLIRCAGVVVTAAHQEAGIYASYSPNFEIQQSDVHFVGGTFYPSRIAGGATIEIDDDPSKSMYSQVTLDSPGWRVLPEYGESDAFIKVKRAVAGTYVDIRNLSSKRASSPGVWTKGALPSLGLPGGAKHYIHHDLQWENL